MKLLPILLIFSATAFAASTEQPQSAPRGLSDTQDFINGAMKDATGGREEDPLRFIAKDMGTIVTDLDQLKTDRPVQAKEERCVAELDVLIKKLEKACKGGGAGSLNPTRPMADSVIAGGPGGIRDLHDPKAGEKQWGNLPAKQREQILQSKTDGFPPGYEAILQSYYRRLAQEQVNDEKNAGSAPTTAPSAP